VPWFPVALALAILTGGALVAAGTALIYLPAGVIVAGIELVAAALLAATIKARRG
jgi:hypothetical protein